MTKILAIFLAPLSLHAAPATPKTFAVKTGVELTEGTRNIVTEALVNLEESRDTWTTVAKTPEEVTVLARVSEARGETVQVEYLVVDGKKDNEVLASPAIRLSHGQSGLVQDSVEGGPTLKVSVVANPVTVPAPVTAPAAAEVAPPPRE